MSSLNKTIFTKEPIFPKYTLPFDSKLIKPIKDKKKHKTYRFGDKYSYLKVNNLVNIVDASTRRMIGKARIISKRATTFGQLPLKIEGHEIYPDKEIQNEVFSNYYAYIGRKIKNDDKFLVFDFKLI